MFHVKHDRQGSADVLAPLDERAAERLQMFEELLRTVAAPKGFLASGEAPVLRERHIDDSLRAAPFAVGASADLGSGSGLPGVPVAIAKPDLSVDLVEPQRKRLAFLELVLERLGLTNARAVGRRVEDLPGRYDTVLARAFGDVRASWAAAERILVEGGSLVYFAGARFDPTALEDVGASAAVAAAPPRLASSGPLVIMTRQ